MTSLFEILKTSKTGMAPDLFTALLAEKFGYTPTPASQQTKTGAPPIYFISDGTPLIAYSIIGNMEQTGTPSSSSPIYPSECGDRTENLFDGTLITGYYNGNINTIDTSPNYRSFRIQGLPAGQYTVSWNIPVKLVRAYYNGVLYGDIGDGLTSYTVTSTDGDIAFSFRDNTSSATPWSNSNTVMLNLGSTALPYEPYGFVIPIVCGNTTTPYYLSEPIRKIDNNVDVASDTATRQIKKLVLDGTEAGWTVYVASEPEKRYFYMTVSTQEKSGETAICTHFSQVGIFTSNTDVGFNFANSGNELRIRPENPAMTNAQFKQWLADQYANGTPVTVWYVLATAETESVTAPSIPTIDGEQTFDIATTLKPSEVTIEYMGW